MKNPKRYNRATGISGDGALGLLDLAGFRYWTASLLPALAGTTLPFWLRPPGFSFKWSAAIEFLIAAALVHAGFSFLQARFDGRSTAEWSNTRLVGAACVCFVIGCLLGLHLNSGLTLRAGVPDCISIVFGLSAFFVGALYVAPPFNFYRRIGGEVVLSVGIGMLPVLGTYLAQVGDITRNVYVAALPLVVATSLWIWICELTSRADDERAGRQTTVMLFPLSFSGRYVTVALTILLYTILVAAVFIRFALEPLSLIALLTIAPAVRIVAISWNNHANERKMLKARKYAFSIHLIISVVIILSSLTALLR